MAPACPYRARMHARTSRSRGADRRSDSSSKRAQLSTVTGSVFSHMVFMEDMPKRSDVTRSCQGQDIARTRTHTRTRKSYPVIHNCVYKQSPCILKPNWTPERGRVKSLCLASSPHVNIQGMHASLCICRRPHDSRKHQNTVIPYLQKLVRRGWQQLPSVQKVQHAGGCHGWVWRLDLHLLRGSRLALRPSCCPAHNDRSSSSQSQPRLKEAGKPAHAMEKGRVNTAAHTELSARNNSSTYQSPSARSGSIGCGQ